MDKVNTIGCTIGPKGSGKSYLTKQILREWPRVVALDPMAEYGAADGFTTAEGRADCLELLRAAAGRRRFRVACRFDDPADGLALLHVVYEMPGVLVVVEETSMYCSATVFPLELSRLVRRGRHRAISQLYVAHRPADISRTITSNADFLCVFRLDEPRDVDYLKAYARTDLEQILTLPQYECVVLGRDPGKFPIAVRARRQMKALDSPPAPADDEPVEGASSS